MEEGDCDYRIFGYMVNEGEDVDGEERLDIPPCYRSTPSLQTVTSASTSTLTMVACLVSSPARLELLTYYRYLLSHCPQWYSDLWDRSS